jgi:hypothetical protein
MEGLSLDPEADNKNGVIGRRGFAPIWSDDKSELKCLK